VYLRRKFLEQKHCTKSYSQCRTWNISSWWRRSCYRLTLHKQARGRFSPFFISAFRSFSLFLSLYHSLSLSLSHSPSNSRSLYQRVDVLYIRDPAINTSSKMWTIVVRIELSANYISPKVHFLDLERMWEVVILTSEYKNIHVTYNNTRFLIDTYSQSVYTLIGNE